MEAAPKATKINSNSVPKSYRDVASKDSGASSAASVDSPLSVEQEAALQLRFPTRVQLSQAKVANATAFWNNAVIAKPLGRDVSPDKMEAALTTQWSTFGDWELFPMAYGLFLCRFASSEIRDTVLVGGPWVVDGAALAMSPFVPEFRPHPSHVTKAIIWVRLPDLPPAVWSGELISDILGIVGRVVRLDEDTEHRRRGRFARAAVEVDLTRPLPPGVAVDVEGGSPPSFWQRFRYEHLHCFCLRCRRVGHRSFACTEPPSSPLVADDLLVRRHRSSRPTFSRVPSSPRGANPTAPESPRDECPRFSAAGPRSSSAAPCDNHTCDVTTHVGAATFPALAAPGSGVGFVGSGAGPVGSCGQSSPLTSNTLADGPKQLEPECSFPSSSVQPEQHFEGAVNGIRAVFEVSEKERHLIQQIMEEDLDSNSEFVDEADFIEDDVLFTTVGKRKKNKGKFPAICLRPAPRDRASMKRTKVASTSSAGKFSLLADLLGGMPPEEIADRHGPP